MEQSKQKGGVAWRLCPCSSQHIGPPPAFKFSPTPEVTDCQSDSTKLTYQISPSWSRDTFMTPPPISSEGTPPVVTVDGMTKSAQTKVPLKSALRRSERLRKSGTAAVSAQRKVGISNLIHVSPCVCVRA